MSKNSSKLDIFTGAFLLMAWAQVVWAQNACTEREPSFICRGTDTFQDCSPVGGINTAYGPNQVCPQVASGQRMLCSMKCPSSCSLPDDTCLTLGTTCRAKGYMANPNNCREYYVCYLNGSTFTRYNYTCAGYFDTAVMKCSNLIEVCDERPLHTV